MANKANKSGRSHQEWLRLTEKHTQGHGPSGVRAARAAFRKLSRPDQLELLAELVEVRSTDLCRAYRNLVDVSIGYKRRYDNRTVKYRFGRIPGITFIVKKKWPTGSGVNPREELPKHLFVYTSIGRKRQLCAVETDVVDGADYAKVGPQAKQILVRPEKNSRSHSATGVIACAVKKTRRSTALYALSCRHVFGITNSKGPSFYYATVRIRKNHAIIGTTTGLRGDLKHNLSFSFDAQACGVDDPDALWQALQNLKLTGHAGNNIQIPDSYWIHVADRAPVKARRASPVPKVGFGLYYGNIGMVVHDQVIEARATTIQGDSGAPCTTHSTGGLLLGMHFAGPKQLRPLLEGPVFMIPAWKLLDRSRYQGGGAKKLWALIGQP